MNVEIGRVGGICPVVKMATGSFWLKCQMIPVEAFEEEISLAKLGAANGLVSRMGRAIFIFEGDSSP